MENARLDKNFIALSAGHITVFNYDATTREYISSSDEYLAIGIGIPANSCVDAPGELRNGFAICRTEDFSAWLYVADHRGESVYNIQNGQRIDITSLGEYPANTTKLIPATAYDNWNGNMWITNMEEQSAAEKAQAEIYRTTLLNQATSEIAWRQDAIDAGIATNAEKTDLAGWKKYRVLLNRVDTAAPIWPNPPDL